ncbi:MAG: DUF1203 domain-containing protein [Alphaproteobacteria bacterium]|nr:DUF1203 domain-containing protein [Alphaproteobacteria bacterium]
MSIRFEALPTDPVRRLQRGAPDAYGAPAEQAVSDGDGVPCRHCLRQVEKGASFLILAYRPFETTQPYAETGPIFLHADPCKRAAASPTPPEILAGPAYILRGYDANERIVYGTGDVIPTADIATRAEALLARPSVSFVDVRSARNNCFQCRIRAAAP